MSRLLLAGLVSITALAQNSIDGTVLNDRTGLPLKRAHVSLRPTKAGGSAIGVDTDEKGSFTISDVEPGRYSLSAARDGYLTSSICLIGTLRLPQIFAVGEKESITNLTFRLRPFAVMAGRISFDDGEPAMNIRVEVYRESRFRLRHMYTLAASAVTNDRGEYRMFGLPPGGYVVAASNERPLASNEKVRDTQTLRDAMTFYPNSTKLSEAEPVRLEYGQEIGGIDIFLQRVRKVRVRGRAISGLTGESVAANISLQRVDAHGTPALAVPIAALFDANKRFELRDVTPGSYVLWAEGASDGKPVVGRVPVTVTESDADNVDVTMEGEKAGSAVLVVEDGVKLADPVHLRFEPRDARGKTVDVAEAADGYRFALMGSDVYDLFAMNLPNNFYVSAVRVNGLDTQPFGIQGIAASATRPFEVMLDSRGGAVSGRVLGSDDSLWSRASVALIPDPPRGRVQSYQLGAADENGLFLLRGVAPGKYTLIAWLDDPPCDYYDPDGLAICRAAGMSVEIQESSQQNVELKMKIFPKR